MGFVVETGSWFDSMLKVLQGYSLNSFRVPTPSAQADMSNSSSVSSSSSSRGGLWDDAAAGRQQQQQHRRGQSLSAKDKDKTKDEDLALFQDMRMREDSAFLHPSMMEMDQGSLTAKFGGLSGYRVSARKGSTDLLTSEADKNDYDWLLTPPGTPLFPSLDRDLLVASPSQRDSSRWSSKLSRVSSDVQVQAEQAPALVHSASSSSSSSSSSIRPAPRGSNPSPRRQSAPTSTSKAKPVSPAANAARPSTPTTRGRPSSSSSSSAPSSSARPSTPTGRARPSTPTRPSTAARPSTPTPRSSSSSAASPFIRPSTPTPTTAAAAGVASRRPSTSNGRPAAASSRGTSPLRKPGPSPQGPELQPPNLRTSAAERPSSNSRGATIPSRPAAAAGNGVDVALLRRQAALPILTRSYNAPHHHDQREMSSFSRRAITSANEGAPISRGAPLEDDKSTAYLKKQQQPLRSCGSRETSFFGTSISKKSLDTAIRHMDIRRSSPGGFRPLMPNAAPLSSSSSYSRAGSTTVARHQPTNRLLGSSSAQTGCEERSQAAGCAKQQDSHYDPLVSDVKARRQGDVVEECGPLHHDANSDLFTANGDDLLLELSSGSLNDDLSSYRRITDAGQELRILEEDYLTL